MAKTQDQAFVPRKVQIALRAAAMRETTDPTPVEIPESHQRPLSLEQRLRQFVRGELSRAAQEDGFESEAEANDLEFPEDDDESDAWSPYQVAVMVEDLDPAEPEEAAASEAVGATESDVRPDPVSTPSEEEKTQPAGSEGP